MELYGVVTVPLRFWFNWYRVAPETAFQDKVKLPLTLDEGPDGCGAGDGFNCLRPLFPAQT